MLTMYDQERKLLLSFENSHGAILGSACPDTGWHGAEGMCVVNATGEREIVDGELLPVIRCVLHVRQCGGVARCDCPGVNTASCEHCGELRTMQMKDSPGYQREQQKDARRQMREVRLAFESTHEEDP